MPRMLSLFTKRQFYWKRFARWNPAGATLFWMSFTHSSSLIQTQAFTSWKCYRSVLALLLKYVWLFINKGFKRALMEKILNVVLPKTDTFLKIIYPV